MKKLLLSMLALALLFGSSTAQEVKEKRKHKGNEVKEKREYKDHEVKEKWKHKGGGEWDDKQLDKLNLSNDQRDRIVAINQNFRTEMENLRSQDLSGEDRRTRMHELHRQHVEQIRAVLSEEQKAKFDAMEKQRGGKKEGKYKYKMKQKETK